MNAPTNPEICPDIILATPPPVTHRTPEENLGLGYLAASLREAGRTVRIIDGWLEGMSIEDIAAEIKRQPPRLFLGFAAYRTNMERAMAVANMAQETGSHIPVVAGGFGPTFHTDEFMRAGLDVVVRGEAEETVLDLASHYEGKGPSLSDIPGIVYRDAGRTYTNRPRAGVADIDNLPYPSRDTMHLAMAQKAPVHILSARGCKGHCPFCSVIAFQKLGGGDQWRQRSITNFAGELGQLAGMGARHFKIIDDSFIEPPRDEEWCRKLADQTEGLDVLLRASIRADRATEPIVRELGRAGLVAVSCGIENGSPTALRRMGKTATVEQNRLALDIFRDNGIYVQAGHILFDDRTTMQELEENYAFLSQYDWTISKGIFSEMYAADGTPFTRALDRRGILQQDDRGLGNNVYPVLDPDARKVYGALKAWQKSHTQVYDMTIDAISAPKALERNELALFHPLCIELKHMDLMFMRDILDMVNAGPTEEEVTRYTTHVINSTSSWYRQFQQKVIAAYAQTGLTYDAEENPFL